DVAAVDDAAAVIDDVDAVLLAVVDLAFLDPRVGARLDADAGAGAAGDAAVLHRPAGAVREAQAARLRVVDDAVLDGRVRQAAVDADGGGGARRDLAAFEEQLPRAHVHRLAIRRRAAQAADRQPADHGLHVRAHGDAGRVAALQDHRPTGRVGDDRHLLVDG